MDETCRDDGSVNTGRAGSEGESGKYDGRSETRGLTCGPGGLEPWALDFFFQAENPCRNVRR